MSLDVYNLSPKELGQLNSSLLKYKENSLLKLHNLQRVNHNLIIENTKLRQTLKYGSSERLRQGPTDSKGRATVRAIEVTVETSDDFTATVYFKCLLRPSEISDFFSCDFSELQYRVVLVEWSNELVENASTVVTKQSHLKLKKLQVLPAHPQNNVRYLVAVHMHGNDRKLSGQTHFVYNQGHTDRKGAQCGAANMESRLKQGEERNQTKESEQKPGKDEAGNDTQAAGADIEPELSVNATEYSLNLQVDEDSYVTCKFRENDSLEEAVDRFMAENKIKGFLRDSLLRCVTELKSSGESVRTVDVSDLICA